MVVPDLNCYVNIDSTAVLLLSIAPAIITEMKWECNSNLSLIDLSEMRLHFVSKQSDQIAEFKQDEPSCSTVRSTNVFRRNNARSWGVSPPLLYETRGFGLVWERVTILHFIGSILVD